MRLNDARTADLVSVADDLTAMQARLLWTLWDARNRYLDYETVIQNVFDFGAVRPQADTICTYVSKLRKVLRRLGWPLRLDVKFDLGYRLSVLQPGWRMDDEIARGLARLEE